MTKADRMIRFLTEGLGMKEVVSSRHKYKKFISKRGGTYWVGRKGGVRGGRTINDSYSLTDKVHVGMERWEKKREVIA